MITSITLWLFFVLSVGFITLFGNVKQAMAFCCVVLVTLTVVFMPLGHPAFWKPPKGEYTVLGVRIDIDEAIYVLLDDGGEPKYYKLPYSKEAAEQLQNAMDGTADGEGSVRMRMSDDRSPGFFEEGGQQEQPKRQEAPMFGGG